MKKFLRWLQFWDFVWSVPLAFVGFFVYGIIQENIFGDPMFSTEWFHRAMLACLIMMLFNGIILGGMYFTFRGIYKYFYSDKSTIRNEFKTASLWLKLLYFPACFFLYLFALIQIFKVIIPMM